MHSNECLQWRQQQLGEAFIESREQLCKEELEQLSTVRRLLVEYHDIFSLDNKCGETGLVEFKIYTVDTSPKIQAVRRISFAV